ncbi:MAG: response regulator [Lachnospiraceae bacterium]|nr:response regulator [Lachnospiraceae bacterium]
MKNRKMSTTITLSILLVITICIALLYIIANKSMTSEMKESEMEALHNSLSVETSIIKEYIYHQEDMLIAFSNEVEVIEFLKDPNNEEKRLRAQKHTEEYYGRLKNWEGLYIGEWNTHVIAHSDENIVGMTTREGEPLKELQDAMLERGGLYNAGIIVSPASGKLILSLYCPVYDYDGETILGYVGGGPFVEELRGLLAPAEKQGASYYMINVNTNMCLLAQDEAMIATEIQDKLLLSVVQRINEGQGEQIGDIEYYDDEQGASVAAYQYISDYGWALISCNSEADIYADINQNMDMLAYICVAAVIIIVILCWVVIRVSTRPLKHVEKAIVQLEQMNLEKDPMLDKYIDGKSEVGQIATAIDSLYDSIEDLLKAESDKQAAIAKNESKDRFLANVSHEIRTPMNVIMGMNQMILLENKDQGIQDYANSIKNSSQHLMEIINDILDFSKIDSGKLQIVDKEYEVYPLLQEITMGMDAIMKQKNLEFVVTIDEVFPKVLKGDKKRIKQILNNLLSNAAKYTDQGKVTFTAKGLKSEEGFALVISVEDTGIGIRPEDMNKVFDSFARVEMNKNHYKEGTGLGLHITKELVECMNGTIELTSEYGKGSCFTVTLPQEVIDEAGEEAVVMEMVAEEREELEERVQQLEEKQLEDGVLQPEDLAQLTASEPTDASPTARLLAVDDNDMNLKIITVFLKNSGLQVDTASSGQEAIDMTNTTTYDLILMDHMMPEMDGVETLHRIREDEENLNRQTKVIVLTANAVAGAREDYLKEGFEEYLTKPVVKEKLEEVVGRYVKNE